MRMSIIYSAWSLAIYCAYRSVVSTDARSRRQARRWDYLDSRVGHRDRCVLRAGWSVGANSSDTSGAFSIASIPESFAALNGAMAAASAIFDTIDRVPSIDVSADDGLKPDKITGELQCDSPASITCSRRRLVDVRFRYPARASVEVLRGVSCTFPAGKTSAIVGPSGAGKSSIVGTLLRFYDPVAGSVQLDGVPIDQLNLRCVSDAERALI